MNIYDKVRLSNFTKRGVGLLLKAIVRDYRNEHAYSFGKKNKVQKNGGVLWRCMKQIHGDGNIIELDRGVICRRVLFHISGNNNLIKLHDNAYLSGCELWIEGNNCKIEIGEKVCITHHSHLAVTEDGSEITIGNNSGCSSYVQMRTGDSHPIYDSKGNRVNKAGSIHIGEKCWIGQGARILKRVTLGDNVIVGTGSVVISSFDSNVTVMGYPAFPVNFGTVHPNEK